MLISFTGLFLPALPETGEQSETRPTQTLVGQILQRVSNPAHSPPLNLLVPTSHTRTASSPVRASSPTPFSLDQALSDLLEAAVCCRPLANALPCMQVYRYPRYDQPDRLDMIIDDKIKNVTYHYSLNAFKVADNRGLFYAPEYPDGNLVKLTDSTRTVTEAERTQTLLRLGVAMQHPIDFSLLEQPKNATAIPKKIASLWLGDGLISEDCLAALKINSNALERSEFKPRLFLSSHSLQTYRANCTAIKEVAPRYEIVALEDDPVFVDFEKGPYYEHYQTALKAKCYTSAAHILGYQILKQEGGLYMDWGATLVHPTEPDIDHPTSLTIDNVALKTTPRGLLLGAPVYSRERSMHGSYDTNLIASHAGNPTLDRICDEMNARFLLNRDFYDSVPEPDEDDLDPAEYKRWETSVSLLTGPALLNAVINKELRVLREIREISVCARLPIAGIHDLIDSNALERVSLQHCPLGRFTKPHNKRIGDPQPSTLPAALHT